MASAWLWSDCRYSRLARVKSASTVGQRRRGAVVVTSPGDVVSAAVVVTKLVNWAVLQSHGRGGEVCAPTHARPSSERQAASQPATNNPTMSRSHIQVESGVPLVADHHVAPPQAQRSIPTYQVVLCSGAGVQHQALWGENSARRARGGSARGQSSWPAVATAASLPQPHQTKRWPPYSHWTVTPRLTRVAGTNPHHCDRGARTQSHPTHLTNASTAHTILPSRSAATTPGDTPIFMLNHTHKLGVPSRALRSDTAHRSRHNATSSTARA